MPDLSAVRAFLEPRHLELAERLATFTGAEIASLPEPDDDDHGRRQAREILAMLGGAGWFAPIGEQDFRGCSVVRDGLAAASPLADAVFAIQALGAVPMLLSGAAPVRRRWLEPTLTGNAMAGFAMTEADAGSDVAAMATTAVRDGVDYVLNGTKTLISNAGIADYYVLFAVTDRTAGTRGLSCFVLDADVDGLRYAGAQVMSAAHPLGELELTDCRVAADRRLGAEGEGFKIGMATLDRLRFTVGAAACGMAAAALEEALRWAVSRRQFGEPLSSFQLVQQKLARMVTELVAARLLVYRAAWEKDLGADRVTVEAAMAKSYATEAAQRIVDDAVQILGGRGVLKAHRVDRLYRSVRALRIYEGTTEIQQLIIAGHLIKSATGSRA